MSIRCLGCMKIKESRPVCEHCGYNENVPNYPHQLPIGTVLQNRYTVGKVLGQGGFGITYIGWDNSLDTPVAVKEYYPASLVNRDCHYTKEVFCNGEGAEGLFAHNRERFLKEAKILAKLSNVPGIVRVQNLFAENNTAYIVMEYVEGIDLKHYIRLQNRVLTVQEAFAVLRPVMYALSKVHEAELVHRDISPDNIMIQKDGSAKLLDFGAAREVADAEVNKELPQSTEAILKHGFAPMEQYQRRGTLGPWTDVYALCATLYYCLTGKVPADAPERVMGDDNVNWRQIPGLTEQQIQTLEKGLALLPENRIRTMRELHAGLFGQTATGFTQVKKEEPKPESTLPKSATTEQKKAEKKPDYPTHTVSLESDDPEANRRGGSSTLPKAAKTEQKKKKPFGLIAAVLAIVAAVGVFALKPKTSSEIEYVDNTVAPLTVLDTDEVTSKAIETVPVTEPVEIPATNVLSKNWFELFTNTIEKDQISSIIFLNTLEDAPANARDVSDDQNGSVKAWIPIADENKTLYIGAEIGIYAPVDSTGLFADFENVSSIHFNGYFCTDRVDNMRQMFWVCNSLMNLDLTDFNTSGVTDMRLMFYGCSSLVKLDLSSFNTSSVTNMNSMFDNCPSLKNLDLSSFDTSKVTDMGEMFRDSSGLMILNLSNFDTSNVTNMSGMFEHCSSLVELDISNFDTSNVIDMSGMFLECSNLPHLDISHFNTSKVALMNGLFYGCSSLTTLDLSNFDTTSATAMFLMFRGCSSLKNLELSSFDTSNVTNMGWMFYCCSSLTCLDLSNFDTSNVTDMAFMFNGCSGLTNLDISNFNTSNVTDMSYMFAYCASLTNVNLSHFDTSNVIEMNRMFKNCVGLTYLDISTWDVSNVVEYSDFMDDGRTINGQPWETLFAQ